MTNCFLERVKKDKQKEKMEEGKKMMETKRGKR